MKSKSVIPLKNMKNDNQIFPFIIFFILTSSINLFSQSYKIIDDFNAKHISIDSLSRFFVADSSWIIALDIDWRNDSSFGLLSVDLNNDGHDEHILISFPLCGTGGCVKVILDGISNKYIGSLFGNPIAVSDVKINGWPVLIIYSHQSADSGFVSTFVFNGVKYVAVSSVMLYGKSVREYFMNLKE